MGNDGKRRAMQGQCARRERKQERGGRKGGEGKWPMAVAMADGMIMVVMRAMAVAW